MGDERRKTAGDAVQRLVTEQYDRALELLTGEREVLVIVAEWLLQKEVMDREELRRLMGRPLARVAS